ncbi:MAG: hypothetical protein ABIH78_00790 [Candidatus Peregrinibacteria bacterium]
MEENRHLRLVSSQSDEDLRRQQELDAIANLEWNCGSFKEALERRDFMLEEVTVHGEKQEDVEAAMEELKSAILRILYESYRSVLALSPKIIECLRNSFRRLARHLSIGNLDPDPENTEALSRQFDLSDHEIFTEQGINIKNLEKRLKRNLRKVEYEDLPGILANLHIKRLKHKIPQFLLAQTGSRMHMERLCSILVEEEGIDMGNSDIVRLAVAELNGNSLLPQIMVIPNTYKPYNPFFTGVEFDESFGLTDEEIRILRVFSR